MHKKEIHVAGKKIQEAEKALILLHGRGAPAEDILGLSAHLAVRDFALLAPQATNHTWYPHSFLALPMHNEPWLSSALDVINELVNDIYKAGIDFRNIFFCGFSQGACLTLEYVARNARPWGGVAAFTGGLIGDRIYPENYDGDFAGCHVFIGSGSPDPHVPVERVQETTAIFRSMHAKVSEKIYRNIGHTIIEDEIKEANLWVFDGRQEK